MALLELTLIEAFQTLIEAFQTLIEAFQTLIEAFQTLDVFYGVRSIRAINKLGRKQQWRRWRSRIKYLHWWRF